MNHNFNRFFDKLVHRWISRIFTRNFFRCRIFGRSYEENSAYSGKIPTKTIFQQKTLAGIKKNEAGTLKNDVKSVSC